MNFAELKDIIKYIKKTIPCSTCKKRLINEDISVLTTHNSEGLFHIHCHHCQNQLLAHITIFENISEGSSSINIETRRTGMISENDYLDIHNFLKQFNGDFIQLFTGH